MDDFAGVDGPHVGLGPVLAEDRAGTRDSVWKEGRLCLREIERCVVAGSFGQPPELVLESPHFLAGTEEQIIEQVQERRERFGFSYVVFGGGSHEAMLPIVAKLAGT